MDRCPLCRAMLHGADTCRRCRAELETAQRVERDSQVLVGAGIYHLYQQPYALTAFAQSLEAMEVILSGVAMSAFQASQQASTSAS